jgi:predicted ATPase/class 3 adenylate cyclase
MHDAAGTAIRPSMPEIRALLLTDIVDSTKLTATLGDPAAAELSTAHDRSARDLLRRWRGREIDKTDGMLVLFEDVDDAVGCALAYHRALAALPVPLLARAGVHVGAVSLRTNTPEDVAQGAKPIEVDGLAKPLAARIMSLAVGGQTLLSAEARDGLGDTGHRVQSHGHWRVKGKAEPVELFEVGDNTAPFAPPPDTDKAYRVVRRGELWLPLREVPHGLPAERDAFIGRLDALADLARRFERGARLVSVLGIGGTGKTRLALRFGWTWLGDFPGGVWFCDLAQAHDLHGLVRAVAQGLDVPLGAEDAVVQLGRVIAGRQACLVILDNFEQVARYAASTLGRWLDGAPAARFLVTSREVLGLQGEEALALPPLAAADGVALFMRRAASAHAGFSPGNDDQAAIAKLVTLLDGLPLAIELAAARIRVMPPAALLARMDQRFRLLVAAGGRHDRQATLRATFDWSWELLTDAEKSALAQLSVFEGGFTLPAAEVVIDLSACAAAPWVVDVLQSLVDKSFVRIVGGSRFGLLLSVQEYAAEHLRTPGRIVCGGAEAEREAQLRHARWFARLADRVAEATDHDEIDNLVAASRRAIRHCDVDLAAHAVAAAWQVLEGVGPFGVGVDLARQALAMPGLDALAHARIAATAGAALDAIGHVYEAGQQVETAVAMARRASDLRLEAQAQVALARLHALQSRPDAAAEAYRMALALARSAGDLALECRALNGLGSVADDLGCADNARGHYSAALRCAQAIGDARWEGRIRANIGSLHAAAGRLDEAQSHFLEALATLRRFGDRYGVGNALCNLGVVQQLGGRLTEASRSFHEALDVARAIGHARLECIAQCNLGLISMDQHRWEEAADRLEAARALAVALGDPRSQALFLGYLSVVRARQGRFDQARDGLDVAQCGPHTPADPFVRGMLLGQRAEVEVLAGRRALAEDALSRARAVATELGALPTSEFGAMLERVQRLLQDRAAPASG